MGIKVTGGVKVPQGRLSVGPVPPAPIYNGLFAWGNNTIGGQLGLGDLTDRNSPVQVGSLTVWSNISGAKYHSHAIKTDGTLWSWGLSVSGQVGDSTNISRSSPVQIGVLTDWSKVAADQQSTFALKTDGSIWSWGVNNKGALGQNTGYPAGNKNSPVQIGSLTDWAIVNHGGYGGRAIKTDGSLWSWGQNNKGQLGLGNTTNKSSPSQVGALTDWANVSGGLEHTLAVKTDGTLWTWGNNIDGRLGIGNTTNKSSPSQIGSLSDWDSIVAGYRHSVAIKTDGSLWTWGSNSRRQLGDGTSTSKSSPVQVGSLTDWSKISESGASSDHVLAIKTDGSLWGWGDNSPNGQIGDGSVSDRNSPVQIGSDTNWTVVSASQSHSLALRNIG